MNVVAAVLYSALLGTSLFMNKYVLSVLGFKYPTIFQGWQMLAGFIIYKILTVFSKDKFSITHLDKPGIVSLLPGFLFFTASIIAGSKALAGLPIPIFISTYNILPAVVYLLDFLVPSRPPIAPLQAVAALVSIVTAASLVFGQIGLQFDDSAYFWLVVGVICSLAHTLHCRIADARYSARDRLYYSYVFSVITLAPASIYLEEAFSALHFHHHRQELFVVGCLASAVLGTSASLYGTRLKQDEYFGPVCHLAWAATVGLSAFVFFDTMEVWQWILVTLNVVSTIPIPSHVTKEEEEGMMNGTVLIL